METHDSGSTLNGSEIAIIGMSGRFPQADDLDTFWRNLRDGVESISSLTDQELLAAGVEPAEFRHPQYVKAAPVLNDIAGFDAAFFGYTPREAELMDPQQRVLLECCWEALEHAGYDPATFPSPIGVFAGAKTNTYLFTLAAHRELVKSMDFFQLILGGDLALLSTRISYKLNLKGPSYAVQTACSTSLVAVHLACQSLLINECRMALAGAVAINVPHTAGYQYQPGGILSPDGHCRAFDAEAAGTIFGSGAGVVALKRLQDALDDGDTIHAVIKGSATNNDGAGKATFTAPSVEGQAAVIIDALAVADVDAETISYVEAHGTGTALGDPIEIAGLTEAFRASTDRTGFCAIGSVKTNVGHLDAAAGMSSLLKTVLALTHQQIPPSLHYHTPNPRIDFANSPFYVNTELRTWQTEHTPRRAGVSSFGFGGTNAHVIVEEAPALPPSPPAPPWQLLPLSAKTPGALAMQATNLRAYLAQHPDANLADVAYTLQRGRQAFAHRRVLVARDHADALALLDGAEPQRVLTETVTVSNRPVAFLFPGQGAQHVGMGHALYEHAPVFRATVDQCCALLQPLLGLDLRALLYPTPEEQDAAAAQLRTTAIAQPALFVIEYALAQLWLSAGLQPSALLGHSLGELVAATLAAVFTLPDALRLVAARGRLMQACPPGALLAVPLAEAALAPLLGSALSLAAVNGPRQCVVAGPEAAIAALAEQLQAQSVSARRLPSAHAFHSALLDPAVAAFAQEVARVPRAAPQIPFISNVSGTWITAAEASDPHYWAQQLRQPVRFAAGLSTLLATPDTLLLEVGPGTTLSTLARQQERPQPPLALASLRHAQDQRAERAVLLSAAGQLWLQGVALDWAALHAAPRRRVPLPTYPFEHQRFWIDLPTDTTGGPQPAARLSKQADLADWFYLPAWEATPAPVAATTREQPLGWLILGDDSALSTQLVERLRQQGDTVRLVLAGASLDRHSDSWTINPDVPGDYMALLIEQDGRRWQPDRIIHLWNMSPLAAGDAAIALATARQRGFESLLHLVQALNQQRSAVPIQITVVTTEAQAVAADEPIVPAKALIQGACLVLPQEYPGLRCRSIDLAPHQERSLLVELLLAEFDAPGLGQTVAYRDGQRWELRYLPHPLGTPEGQPALLRSGGVYWLIGGLGGIGLTLAEHLARTVRARLVLTNRHGLPPRSEWTRTLEQHPSDGQSRQIRAVQALEALGAEVLVLPADIADGAQLQAVSEQIVARFGELHGVIHAAGTARGAAFKAAQETTPADCELHFASKVQGLIALEQVLQGHQLDFCLLCSSLSAVLGGLGNVAYAAASCFMDAFAREQQRVGRPWLSVNWDSWHQPDDADQGALGVTLVELAIQPDEGVAAFERILAATPPPIVVSTGPLQARIDQWVKLAVLRADGGQRRDDRSQPSTVPQQSVVLPGGRSELERRLTAIWAEVLGVASVGLHDNFFDLGGNSLSGMQLLAELKRQLDVTLAPVALFEAPTVAALATLISPEPSQEQPALIQPRRPEADDTASGDAIAIIGLAGRFPGADSVAAFWDNLQQGVESITFFEDEQLRAQGIDPALLADPRYVKARPRLSDVAGFDAAFFGYTPREAELMDPQHRIFLESAWQALEHAGYAPGTYSGPIGVYAGASLSTYLLNLYANQEFIQQIDPLQTIIGNASDSLTTSVSYKLNLKGPSLAVQTFCSTSLVAVHLACQSIARGECDLALAGGVSVLVPQDSGYHHQEEGIVSPDGHCRAFDADAGGTLFGNGVGVVVLKRLDAALRDGDTIHAVIKGSAINNDGAVKVGYTAPSVDGQAAVIRDALSAAQIDPATISYVEAHGTGTALGDPIEVAALTKAFRHWTDRSAFCALGSVKTNVGHLDRAAGVTALIKTVLALRHQQIPPSLHFARPNPKIDFAASPFFVNTALRPWPSDGTPRRAGVSALGFGGTNAHVIVEEAPAQPPSAPAPPWQLLPLSAKTPGALATQATNLRAYLAQHPDANLADVAYTLQRGRQAFAHRRVLVVHDHADALALLDGAEPERVLESVVAGGRPNVAFLFPGQGAQHVGMGHALYEHAPVFRATVDHCARLLEAHLGLDLRTLLYPAPEEQDDAAAQLRTTALAQPALFVIEYALAQLWLSAGVQPSALLGHSLGELVAATLAAVFTLPDALRLVAARGRLMQACPPGALLAVPLAEAALAPLLAPALSLAAVNGPRQCVVAGPEAAVAALAEQLQAQSVSARRLPSAHAFHSALLDPAVAAFAQEVARVPRAAPQIPFLSNLSGTWITDAEASDPHYWAQQLRQPVRFAAGLSTLLATPDTLLLEVGPGTTLSTLARQQERPQPPLTVASLRHAQDQRAERAVLLSAAGQLWLQGVALDWAALHAAPRRRVPLPTYPFEHQRFWVDGQVQQYVQRAAAPTTLVKRPEPADWFYLPAWRHTPLPTDQASATLKPGERWLLLLDEQGVGVELARQLIAADQQVITVQPGAEYRRVEPERYLLRPQQRDDYHSLLSELAAGDQLPAHVVHLWSITATAESPTDRAGFDRAQERGWWSLLYLTQVLGQQTVAAPVQIDVVSNQLYAITDAEHVRPEKTPLLGLCTVIPQEYPQLNCRSIDLAVPRAARSLPNSARQLLAELAATAADMQVAYRGQQRWTPYFEQVRLSPSAVTSLRDRGVYLITGGLAEIGLALSDYLARAVRARLVLVEAPDFPQRADWQQWLVTHAAPDEISDKIRSIQALEQAGAQVLVHSADVTDPAALRAAVDAARVQFGALNGVIYAAGVVGERAFRSIQELDQAECELHFALKAHGLLALEQVLSDEQLSDELDFCVIDSSLSAFLGGRGYAAYAAGSLFIDAFTRSHNQAGGAPWLSINWDAWRLDKITVVSQNLAQLSMTPEEGGEVFRQALAGAISDQLIVSTADLHARLDQTRQGIQALRGLLAPAAGGPSGPRHPRPGLKTPYVPPTTELERAIAEVWQQMLGFEQIGVLDNFFELGGDSLIAIQVVTRMKEALQQDVAVVSLYEQLTIQGLAELLSREAEPQEDLSKEREARQSLRKQYRQKKRARREDRTEVDIES